MKALLSLLLLCSVVTYGQAQTCGFDAHNASEYLSPADQLYLDEFSGAPTQNVLKAMQEQSVARSQSLIVVPLVVHVVHNGEAEGNGANLSTARIEAQIEALNAAFSATNANFGDTPAQWQGAVGSPEIRFCLAKLDPDGNPTTGITRQQIAVTGTNSNQNNINSVIKPALSWDVTRYVNVYSLGIPGTTAQSGVVGYSYYPVPGVYGDDIDGLVIDYHWLGGPGFGQSGFSTMTHEMGHYLGLYHPFNGNSCDFDDGLADTPNMGGPTNVSAVFSCANAFPTGPNTCGEEHMYVNYMDYSTDNCYTSFTNEQIAVMRAVLDGTAGNLGFVSRADLVSNAASACQLPANNATLVGLLDVPENNCASDSIYASLIIRNGGTTPLTSTQLFVTVDFNAPFAISWTGNLALGETDTFALPPARFFPGNSYYEIYSFNPNGETDEVTNDDLAFAFFTTVGSRSLPYEEDAEGETGYPLAGSGLESVNVQGDDFFWQIAQGVGAYGTSNDALVFQNSQGGQANNPYGTLDALVIPHLDLTGLVNPELRFDVAYAPYDDVFSDTLRVLAAPGCFAGFSDFLWEKGGATLATAPANTGLFVPTATEWRTEVIPLTDYVGETALRLALLNRSFWGNSLFIDNIRVAERQCDLTVSASATDETSVDGNDGSATATTGGGTAGYTYLWSNGGTTATLQNLAPGDYTVTVTDADNCQAETTITVAAFACTSFSAQLSGQPVDCFGGQSGSISVSINGTTTMPLAYDWSNGATTTDVAGLIAGAYALTVTDGTGCTASATVTITEPTAIAAIPSSTAETALAAHDGTAGVSVSGGTAGYSYLWSNNATTAAISGLVPGNYCVTITDANGCTTSTCADVAAYVCPAAFFTVSGNSLSCAGAQDGSVTSNFSGGTPPITYAWSNGATTDGLTGLPGGTYGVTVTDAAGCTSTGAATLTEPTPLTLSATATDESANAAQDGTAAATVGGGTLPYTYHWSDGNTGATRTELSPGNYGVTITDGNGCTATTVVTVQAFGCALSATATAGPASCDQVADGTASVSVSGTGPFAYDWSNGATGAAIDHLLPGTYGVTVTDGSNCQAVAEATVIAIDVTPPTVSLSPTSAVIGAEGFVVIERAMIDNGSGDNCGAPVDMLIVPNGFYCGTEGVSEVLVTVTDAAGNTATANTTVTITNDLTATATVAQQPSCAGGDDGSATIDITGGAAPYSYQLNNGTTIPDGLTAGNYALTVTDANGCTTTATFAIGEPAALSITLDAVTNTTDGGSNGAIDVTVGGGTPGYIYKWRYNGGIIVSNEEDPTGLLAGDYTLELSDQNGCLLESAIFTVENLTATQEVETHGLTIAPNPAAEWVYLNADVSFRVQLLDLNKRVVFQNDQALTSHRIRVSSLPSGLYLAAIQWSKGEVIYRRVVVR